MACCPWPSTPRTRNRPNCPASSEPTATLGRRGRRRAADAEANPDRDAAAPRRGPAPGLRYRLDEHLAALVRPVARIRPHAVRALALESSPTPNSAESPSATAMPGPPPSRAGTDRIGSEPGHRRGPPAVAARRPGPARSDGRMIAVHPESAAAAGAVGSFVRHRGHRKIRPSGSSTSRETCPQDVLGHRESSASGSPSLLHAACLSRRTSCRASRNRNSRPTPPPLSQPRSSPTPAPIPSHRPPRSRRIGPTACWIRDARPIGSPAGPSLHVLL